MPTTPLELPSFELSDDDEYAWSIARYYLREDYVDDVAITNKLLSEHTT